MMNKIIKFLNKGRMSMRSHSIDFELSTFHVFFLTLFSLENIFLLLLEKEEGREGERKREKHQCKTEAPIGCFPEVP